MDSKKINRCRDYTILFYDEKSSTDLSEGLNEAKKAEAKLEKVHWRKVEEGEAGMSGHCHDAKKVRRKEGTNQADHAADRLLVLQQYTYKRLREGWGLYYMEDEDRTKLVWPV